MMGCERLSGVQSDGCIFLASYDLGRIIKSYMFKTPLKCSKASFPLPMVGLAM
jgi:hypothetical protein